jgi:hypothetical protein
VPDNIDSLRETLERMAWNISEDRVDIDTTTVSPGMDDYMARAIASRNKTKTDEVLHLRSLLDSALLENENLRSKIEELEDNLKQDRFDY